MSMYERGEYDRHTEILVFTLVMRTHIDVIHSLAPYTNLNPNPRPNSNLNPKPSLHNHRKTYTHTQCETEQQQDRELVLYRSIGG